MSLRLSVGKEKGAYGHLSKEPQKVRPVLFERLEQSSRACVSPVCGAVRSCNNDYPALCGARREVAGSQAPSKYLSSSAAPRQGPDQS